MTGLARYGVHKTSSVFLDTIHIPKIFKNFFQVYQYYYFPSLSVANQVQQRNLGVSGRIFTIESTRARGRTGNMLKLKVNFLPEIITLSKEVRNLKWLSFRVPLAIVNKAHQANQLYPFAISLIESVRTYERTCEKVEERSSISLLVAGLKKEVQALVTEGITLVWESYKLDPYVQRLAETVFNFQEKVSGESHTFRI